MKLKKKKETRGRKPKDNVILTGSIPSKMSEYILSIGHGSPSLGMRLMWENTVKPTLGGGAK